MQQERPGEPEESEEALQSRLRLAVAAERCALDAFKRAHTRPNFEAWKTANDATMALSRSVWANRGIRRSIPPPLVPQSFEDAWQAAMGVVTLSGRDPQTFTFEFVSKSAIGVTKLVRIRRCAVDGDVARSQLYVAEGSISWVPRFEQDLGAGAFDAPR